MKETFAKHYKHKDEKDIIAAHNKLAKLILFKIMKIILYSRRNGNVSVQLKFCGEKYTYIYTKIKIFFF